MKFISLTLACILSVTQSLSQTHHSLFPASPQVRMDGRAAFENNDEKLNQAYKMLLIARQSDSTFINNLKASERLWIQFRDAEFTLKFPDHPQLEHRDSLSNDQAVYLAHFTDYRTRNLIEWLKIETSDLDDFYERSQPDVFVSDIRPLRSVNFDSAIGINKPSWSNQLVIRGRIFKQGLIIQPPPGGKNAYVEYPLNFLGKRLQGTVGWAEKAGIAYQGKMRFRIYVDNRLIFADEIVGMEIKVINIELNRGRTLMIETDDGFDGNLNDFLAFGDLKITR